MGKHAIPLQKVNLKKNTKQFPFFSTNEITQAYVIQGQQVTTRHFLSVAVRLFSARRYTYSAVSTSYMNETFWKVNGAGPIR